MSESKWQSNLTQLIETCEQYYLALGYDANEAAEHAQGVALMICENFGGVQFYMPTAKRLKIYMRDQEIRREFNGVNVEELAKKYDLTTSRIYFILNDKRKMDVRQQDLF